MFPYRFSASWKTQGSAQRPGECSALQWKKESRRLERSRRTRVESLHCHGPYTSSRTTSVPSEQFTMLATSKAFPAIRYSQRISSGTKISVQTSKKFYHHAKIKGLHFGAFCWKVKTQAPVLEAAHSHSGCPLSNLSLQFSSYQKSDYRHKVQVGSLWSR